MKPRVLVPVVTLLAVGAAATWYAAQPIQPPPSTTTPAGRAQIAEKIARPHLKEVTSKADKALDERLKELDEFFANAKNGTPKFAEEALSFGSKWRLMVDWVPYTKGGRLEKHLRSLFERLVFTPTSLQECVEQVIKGFQRELDSIDSKMLVDLRVDVAKFPTTFPMATLDDAVIRKQIDQALRETLASTRHDLAAGVTLLIASEIAMTVFTKVATSMGMLSAGAVVSPMTGGVSFIVGLILDQIISWVWNWYDDPVGTLTAQINVKLDGVCRLIVEGDDGGGGLRARLKAFAADYSDIREKVVLGALAGSGE